MKSFFNVQDLGNLDTALTEALEVKRIDLVIKNWVKTRPY
jgi:hypothetical protein